LKRSGCCIALLHSLGGRRERHRAFSSPIKATDRAVIGTIWHVVIRHAGQYRSPR
jgi:hypothetical protein